MNLLFLKPILSNQLKISLNIKPIWSLNNIQSFAALHTDFRPSNLNENNFIKYFSTANKNENAELEKKVISLKKGVISPFAVYVRKNFKETSFKNSGLF